MKTNLEQLDIAIVEALWGMGYEYAVKNERKYQYKDEKGTTYGDNYKPHPNTIGRVMAALHMIRTPNAPFNIGDDGTLVRTHFTADGLKCDDICKWEDLAKGTTKDQSPETIEKLLELFKK